MDKQFQVAAFIIASKIALPRASGAAIHFFQLREPRSPAIIRTSSATARLVQYAHLDVTAPTRPARAHDPSSSCRPGSPSSMLGIVLGIEVLIVEHRSCRTDAPVEEDPARRTPRFSSEPRSGSTIWSRSDPTAKPRSCWAPGFASGPGADLDSVPDGPYQRPPRSPFVFDSMADRARPCGSRTATVQHHARS